jgi:N-6 DNA Methylase
MLNLRVAGNFLSTYYLADANQFLRAERGHVGEASRDDGLRMVRRVLRRAALDLDDTSTLAATRRAVVPLLATLGFDLDTGPAAEVGDGLAADAVVPGPDGEPLCYAVFAPPGQHLDANPVGRRQGDARPQRRLERLLRHGKAPFGIATNGRELRVVAKDPGLGGEAAYLAVDLAGLAEYGDEHELRLAWALLRPDAMVSEPDGESLYERAERASQEAAAKVSDDLSVGVRKAIEALAQGAIDDLRARDVDPPDLRELFGDALTVAYRLLFVAFAEDRGLLPVDVPAYRSSYGFAHLRDEVLAPGAEWTGGGSYLWESATALFRLLRDGADVGEFRVAAYNGGLFDPNTCRWFDRPVEDGRGQPRPVRLADTHVATAIEHLSVTRTVRGRGGRVRAVADGSGRRRVNYRELSVEQLGSVYEGLLAFEPRLAREPMVLAELRQGAKRVTQIVARDRLPEGATELEEVPEGRFYLFEASGQRKGSGSYYTPRAICAFLAREALEPLVAGRSSKEILDLRVIDPAMGSGAFLVAAVHFLAEACGQARIAEGMDADHLIDDEERAAYRRVVVERCIYGVDKNPMAVELAKVSLWLATASADRPLSFLDAKLRCGDSLVGAFLDDLDRLPPVLVRGRKGADEAQLRLPVEGARADLARLAAGRRELALAPSDFPEQVRDKGARLRRYLDAEGLHRLRLRANLWVSAFSGPSTLHPSPAVSTARM